MAYDIRYPMITGASEREQLIQMKSYLHQLVEQLNYSLNNIDTLQVQYITAPPKSESSRKEADKGTQVTFNALKPLIIKSAEIVNAYYEEINERLEGTYVAQSDFGTFQEQTLQEITKNSTEITQVLTNVQTIVTDVNTIGANVQAVETNLQDTKVGIGSNLETLSDEVGQLDSDLRGVKEGVETNLQGLADEVGAIDSKLEDAKSAINSDIETLKNELNNIVYSIIEVNAHIKSGLLYYDENEIPIYGLEIGQINIIDGVEVFNKYARFTAGRLSFYDKNDTEVAYISDYKLYITNAEITGTLKLGAFLVDTTYGFRLKYVGRR